MKKILSALMFAVVLFGMTNVMSSCKDYDYDIEQLRNELNQKSTLLQFQDSVNSLNRKINLEMIATAAAQEAADKAIKAAQEAKQAGLDAAAQAKAAAEAADEVIKARLQQYADMNDQRFLEFVNSTNKKFEDLINSTDQKFEDLNNSTDEKLQDYANKAEQDVNALRLELKAYVDQAREDALAAAQEYVDHELTIIRDSLSGAYTSLANLREDLISLKTKVDSIPVEEFKTNIKTLQDQYTEIRNRFTAIVGAYSTMITSVDIFQEVKDDGSLYNKPALNFMVAEELENTFGPTGKELTFTNQKMTVYSDSIIIRVNPVGATITKSMVKLLDSQNNSLDNFVEVEKVEQVEDLIASRAAAQNGLWKVVFKLKAGYDAAALTKATGATFNADGSISSYRLFAVGISNGKSESLDARCVVSNYGLKVKTGTFVKATDLTINNKSISEIKNRVTTGGKAIDKTIAAKNQIIDYLWDNATQGTPLTGIPQVKAITSGSESNVASVYDIRYDKSALHLDFINGHYEMNFDFSSGNRTNGVRAFYVLLDTAYVSAADGVDPSEREAWLRYKYTNLNTLIDGDKGTVIIDETKMIQNEEIGFRVFAVNYDGTLADPDGMAFYVSLGDTGPAADQLASGVIEPSRTNASIRQVVIPLQNQFKITDAWDQISYYSGYSQQRDQLNSGSTAGGNFTAYAKKDASDTYMAFDIQFHADADGSGIIVAPKDAKSVVVSLHNTSEMYVDDYAYTIPLKLINTTLNNQVMYTVNLQVTKHLPQFLGLENENGLISEGSVITAFTTDGASTPWTSNFNAAITKGTTNLAPVFSNIADIANWQFSVWKPTGKTPTDLISTTSGSAILTGITPEVIADGKDYAMTVGYRDPMSKQSDGTRKVWQFEYKLRMVSWWHEASYSYKDGKVPSITFNQPAADYNLENVIVSPMVSFPGTDVSKLINDGYLKIANGDNIILLRENGKTLSQFTAKLIKVAGNPAMVHFDNTIGSMMSEDEIKFYMQIIGKDCFNKNVTITVPAVLKR